MGEHAPAVIAGVDTHKDTHYAAVITDTGRHLEAALYPATADGYRALTEFITGFGPVSRVGVEGTGSYGAGLTRHLTGSGLDVVEVLRPTRQVRRMRGKSDEIDAYAAAESALAGTSCSTPKQGDGLVEAIRVVTTARRSAVHASTDAALQIRDLIVTAPDPVRSKYRVLQGKALITALANTRPQDRHDTLPGHTLITLRALARRIQQLRTEIDEHDQALADLVARVNPSLVQAKGIGVISAADLLITAGDNPERINSEAAFAALCGASPIPASSGQITRHRLNRGGNRHANCALHRIAIVRLHVDERTRTYAARRKATGKTNKDILRCLKRAIAREVYHLITNPPVPIDTSHLRPKRQAAGLTLATAARDLGCSITALSYIERGRSSSREKITTYRDYLTSRQAAA